MHARMDGAGGRSGRDIRHRAARNRVEQGPRVSVLRMLPDLMMLSALHDLPTLHHVHPVGDVAHDRQVMGDEEVRKPQLLLKLDQQVLEGSC